MKIHKWIQDANLGQFDFEGPPSTPNYQSPFPTFNHGILKD
jgi:hypothetical protein